MPHAASPTPTHPDDALDACSKAVHEVDAQLRASLQRLCDLQEDQRRGARRGLLERLGLRR